MTRPPWYVDLAMADLDRWVNAMNAKDGPYVPENFVHDGCLYEHGIQQVKREVYDLCKVLEKEGISDSILEIGLGVFGSSHRLWLSMFDMVTTIEQGVQWVNKFVATRARMGVLRTFGKGRIVCGSSHDKRIVQTICREPKVGCLFIDGSHRYQDALRDWRLYRDHVRSGGMVVFHDSALWLPPLYEIPLLVEYLREGGYDVKEIVHCRSVGTAYYKVP